LLRGSIQRHRARVLPEAPQALLGIAKLRFSVREFILHVPAAAARGGLPISQAAPQVGERQRVHEVSSQLPVGGLAAHLDDLRVLDAGDQQRIQHLLMLLRPGARRRGGRQEVQRLQEA